METMSPNPVWDAESYPSTVETFAALGDELTIRVWGGDWCGDCRNQLPDFAAAMAAAGVPEENIHEYPVDNDKNGELTEEYGIEYIPTIVVERDGEEVARFVEQEPQPAAVYLADRLQETL
ncbi:thioredoxin family protein [Haladaptatus sp. CMSO5]|uniref:thioredoxin family protein n=1 Tax=Haladaptatus sp. CMSO5 TaxID=3120514 RepID=UPI002FCE1D47